MQPYCLFSGWKTEFHGGPAAFRLNFQGSGAMLMIHTGKPDVTLHVRQARKSLPQIF
jgi:hypothetical protein